MRAVVQRVTEASVAIHGEPTRAIAAGALVLVGVTHGDLPGDADWLADKLARLRLFDGPDGHAELTVGDIGGSFLVISQFTLYGSVRKGTRPSWNDAAPPAVARPLIDHLVSALQAQSGRPVLTGTFGAHMLVRLANDGPVTLVIDTPARPPAASAG